MPGSTSSRRGNALLVTAMVAMVIGLVPGAARASEFSDKNHPEYWQDLGYGTCVKYENPATPYVLGAPPAGSTWSLLVVKAGSETSTNDPHAEYPNPIPGSYYHPSGKQISHVIVCRKPGGGTTTTTGSTTTTTGDPCGNYTPRSLAVDKASAEPGDTVIVTGTAGGGDTLTLTISGTGVTTRTLGTVTVPSSGTFSIGVILPDDYPAGTFTIKVKSTQCPSRTGTVSITTQSVNRSGCGTGNPLVIIRNTATTWKLITGTPQFNTSKPVTLTLTQRAVGGASYTLYTGQWGNGIKTITVPSSAPLDRYFLVQSGSQQGNNKPRTESCPVRVATSTSLTATTISAAKAPDRQSSTVQITVVAVICGAMLLRLRVRNRAGRRAA